MNTHRSLAPSSIANDFGRTRWSMVVAVREGSEAQARRSLGELCRRYWVPVYVYVRRCGHSPERAALLVQRFLSQLVARLRISEPRSHGGFRNFLQSQLEEFVGSAERQAAPADTLADIEPPWPLDEIEQRQLAEHHADVSPTQALQRAFALELLAISLQRLRNEAQQSGRMNLFEAVRPYLSREPRQSDYAALAARVKSSPLAMVVAVKRLRQRFQELVDEELAQTVGDAQSLQNERQTLLSLAAPDPTQ
jgi:RNA polymerase sigma-70 factor (ECF subfamily)